MPLVTVSASYGAGGSEVAPALAERLGVRFVDRVVSLAELPASIKLNSVATWELTNAV